MNAGTPQGDARRPGRTFGSGAVASEGPPSAALLSRRLGQGAGTSIAHMIIRNLEVSRDIAASPEVVYAAIADVTRMGEWSTECHTCAWLDGATEAIVGARFEGHNKNNDHEWTVQSTVTAAEVGRVFNFDCAVRDFTFASWGYAIEATDDGCRVTESWTDHRPDEMIEAPSASGVEDRAAYNRASMATTLERIAAAVE